MQNPQLLTHQPNKRHEEKFRVCEEQQAIPPHSPVIMIILIISGLSMNNILHVKEDQHSPKYIPHMNFSVKFILFGFFYKQNGKNILHNGVAAIRHLWTYFFASKAMFSSQAWED